jgi:hypothetical protein
LLPLAARAQQASDFHFVREQLADPAIKTITIVAA